MQVSALDAKFSSIHVSGDFCERCEQASCMAAICSEARYQNLVACMILDKNCDGVEMNAFNATLSFEEAVRNKWKKCAADLGDGCKAYFYVNDHEKNLFEVAVSRLLCCSVIAFHFAEKSFLIRA